MPSYEELVGGLGRAIAYRAERYLVRELISDSAATLVSSGQQYPLYDIAMNGISLDVPVDDPQWDPGAEITATLLIHNSPVYRGPVRIARVEPVSHASKRVGLQLMRGFIDLPEIRRQDEQATLSAALEQGPDPVRAQVPPPYREAMERAAHFLQFYRQTLDRQQQRFDQMGDDGKQAIATMTRQAINALRRRWQEIRQQAAEAAGPVLGDPVVKRAIKAYTETLVTPLLLAAPVLARAYGKPLGYPGDYQTMLYIYRNELEGQSTFGQVLHKLAVEEPLAAGVRGRRDFLKALQRDEHRRHRGAATAAGDVDGTFRVASLGSGPAREVVEFIEETRRWTGQINWTLIDQEEQTLSLAYHAAFREIALNNSPASVRCVYVSFKQLVGSPESILTDGLQHLLYAAGIFDYLGKHRARRLATALLDFVAPGGLLAIGNAAAPNDHFWTTELALDWSLVFRTRQEMLDLAEEVLPAAESVEVVAEPTGAYWFLLIRKQR